MKLTIQKLTSLSAQDKTDLPKIWPGQTEHDWQRCLGGNRALFVAVFNERILGAVKVTISGNTAALSDLMVREVTRRRGVGLYLMTDMQAQLPQVDNWEMKAESDAVTAEFMRACGFIQEGNLWKKRPTESRT